MRYPAVSGSFYTSSSPQLASEAGQYLSEAGGQVQKKERLAIVCPHAGYVYSGRCAAYSYAACSNWKEKRLAAIIIGPNHTGVGQPVSVSFEDWKTPLGVAACDVALAEAIVKESRIARRDELAHSSEHSSEVQLPFLQTVAPHASFVGICMGFQDIETARDLGKAVFEAVKKAKKNAIVIASSDFTHYEPAEAARKKDTEAIKRLLAMDEEGFESLVEESNLSICGHGPIAAAMHYAKLAGARKCELLKYTNSGEASGDYQQVVAYAALAISR